MGKHLSIEEKHNAANELIENREMIKWLRQEINSLQYRNKKLTCYLKSAKRSEYDGLYHEKSDCFQEFGKKRSELTPEELRQYNRYKKRESRARLGRN